jgi:hypothetical protein
MTGADVMDIETAKGWDTIGATDIGVLTDGRFMLGFTGAEDGVVHNVFIPAEAVAPLVATLIAVNAKAAKTMPSIGDEVSGKFLLEITQSSVLAGENGTEFALSLMTRDELALRLHFDPNTIEALATGIVAVLAKHGRYVDLPRAPGRKH